MSALECGYCGDDAIESEDGLFEDGAGGACKSCGFPGQVSLDDGDEENIVAYWHVSEDDVKIQRYFVARIHAIRDDPDKRYVGEPATCDPESVHKPADDVLLEALRCLGYYQVADAYDELVKKSGGTFWYA